MSRTFFRIPIHLSDAGEVIETTTLCEFCEDERDPDCETEVYEVEDPYDETCDRCGYCEAMQAYPWEKTA